MDSQPLVKTDSRISHEEEKINHHRQFSIMNEIKDDENFKAFLDKYY